MSQENNDYRMTLDCGRVVVGAFIMIDRAVLELASQLLRRSLVVEYLLRDTLQPNERVL